MPRKPTDKLRIALVHYWLTSWGGGERVLRALADMFPQADIYTLVANEAIAERFSDHTVTTSFVQRLPGSVRWHRHFLPLYPLALEQFDLREYDLVISSHSGPAHGVLTSASTCHVCYCHSPLRYIWDFYHDYMRGNEIGSISRLAFLPFAHYLRMWDTASAGRVDFFAANSHNVASRIHKHYRRRASVIYPPVSMAQGNLAETTREHYLFVGRLVDYKRADIAVEACTHLRRPLHVVGSGPQLARLQQRAGPFVHFLGDVSDEQLQAEYASCRALLFPGEEDFGIVPVEAQSYGKPVIAYGRGGVRESVLGVWTGDRVVRNEHTGVFVPHQNVDSLADAIRYFESNEDRFAPESARNQAENFSTVRFEDNVFKFVESSMETHSTWLYDPAMKFGEREDVRKQAAGAPRMEPQQW